MTAVPMFTTVEQNALYLYTHNAYYLMLLDINPIASEINFTMQFANEISPDEIKTFEDIEKIIRRLNGKPDSEILKISDEEIHELRNTIITAFLDDISEYDSEGYWKQKLDEINTDEEESVDQWIDKLLANPQ